MTLGKLQRLKSWLIIYLKASIGRVFFISLKIYDRVGEKVFETSDILEGWDGNLLGLPMNNNEFVYMLEVTYCNGQIVEVLEYIGILGGIDWVQGLA